jgi:hypothetical protein
MLIARPFPTMTTPRGKDSALLPRLVDLSPSSQGCCYLLSYNQQDNPVENSKRVRGQTLALDSTSYELFVDNDLILHPLLRWAFMLTSYVSHHSTAHINS